MKDGIKIIIAIVVLVAIVIVCVKLGKEQFPNTNTVVGSETEISENEDVDSKDNDENTNEVVEEKTEEKDENVTTTVIAQNDGSQIYETDSLTGSTSEKEAAIDLVEDKWGEDDTVEFVCDHVTDNGEYVIAVVSIESAEVLNYFKVNLENKTVNVDY